MKVQEFKPEDVIVNLAIKTRKGELDQETIDRIAISYQERAENGQEPQMQPGLVRASNGKTIEIVDGAHRWAACKVVNDAGGINGQPMPFLAYLVKEGDMDAIVSSIVANEYRKATNIFDRAEAMQKLVDLGKTQVEVAAIFGLSEGSVTQTLKAGQLEKKYIKAVLEGDMEQDAAIIIADLPVDSVKRQEIFDECVRHRNRLDEVMQRREHEKAKEAAALVVAEAKIQVEEAEVLAKEADRRKKAAEKLIEKTKDAGELEAARIEREAAM